MVAFNRMEHACAEHTWLRDAFEGLSSLITYLYRTRSSRRLFVYNRDFTDRAHISRCGARTIVGIEDFLHMSFSNVHVLGERLLACIDVEFLIAGGFQIVGQEEREGSGHRSLYAIGTPGCLW